MKVICTGYALEATPLIQRVAKAVIQAGMTVCVVSQYYIPLDSVMYKCQMDMASTENYDCIILYKQPNSHFAFDVDDSFNTVFAVEEALPDFNGPQYIFNTEVAAGLSPAQQSLNATDWLMLREIERLLFKDNPNDLFVLRESLRQEASINYEQYNQSN